MKCCVPLRNVDEVLTFPLNYQTIYQILTVVGLYMELLTVVLYITHSMPIGLGHEREG
jgi:hypothetical protein